MHHPIVLGVPRSGTSLCANLLSKMGFDFVGCDSMDSELPSKFNPDGYFQRKSLHCFLRTCIQKDFDNFHQFCSFTSEERKIFVELLPKQGKWGIKEPYLQRYLPDVTAMTPDKFVYIVVYRNPHDTIQSIKKMQKEVLNHTNYTEETWQSYYTNVIRILKTTGSKVVFLSYDDLVLQPEATYANFVTDLQKHFRTLKPLTRKQLFSTITCCSSIKSSRCSGTSQQLLHLLECL